jgi:hypothetical protein
MSKGWGDPRHRLPPEAKRFLSAIRWHFGPNATRYVSVFHKPIPSNTRETDIGNSTGAKERPKL